MTISYLLLHNKLPQNLVAKSKLFVPNPHFGQGCEIRSSLSYVVSGEAEGPTFKMAGKVVLAVSWVGPAQLGPSVLPHRLLQLALGLVAGL